MDGGGTQKIEVSLESANLFIESAQSSHEITRQLIDDTGAIMHRHLPIKTTCK